MIKRTNSTNIYIYICIYIIRLNHRIDNDFRSFLCITLLRFLSVTCQPLGQRETTLHMWCILAMADQLTTCSAKDRKRTLLFLKSYRVAISIVSSRGLKYWAMRQIEQLIKNYNLDPHQGYRLTHWARYKMADVLLKMFSNPFYWVKGFIIFRWNFIYSKWSNCW